MPCLAVDEYRRRAVGQHFRGLAAEHESRNTASAVRGHGDQIAAPARRGLDDRLVGMVVIDLEDLAGNASRLCLGEGLAEMSGRLVRGMLVIPVLLLSMRCVANGGFAFL